MLRAVTALLSLVLLLAAGCDAGETPQDVGGPTPADGQPDDDAPRDEETPGATEAARTGPDGDRTPTGSGDDVLVAVDAEGRVVVLDAATGEVVRELQDGVPVDDPASNDLAMSPDGEDVFVVVPPEDPTGSPEIVRLSVDGEDQEILGEGTVPAVSPDGGTLAHVVYEEPSDVPVRHPEPVLLLRDLQTGEETRLAREEPLIFIPDVEWTADGTEVIFTAGEIHTGLYAVDPGAESLDQARRLGPELGQDPTRTTSWGPVAALDEDRLAVAERCCDLPPRERWHLVAVDVEDGTVEEDLLEERVEATHLDSDGAGQDLLIVARGGPGGGELLRWDGQGTPESVADDVIVAAW